MHTERRTPRLLAALLALIAGLLLCACSGTGRVSGDWCPVVTAIVAGNGQSASPGTALPSPLAVEPRLALGQGSSFVCDVVSAPSQRYAWTVESGGGSIRALADSGGYTNRAVWTLGPAAGAQSARATWTNAPRGASSTVLFSATALTAR